MFKKLTPAQMKRQQTFSRVADAVLCLLSHTGISWEPRLVADGLALDHDLSLLIEGAGTHKTGCRCDTCTEVHEFLRRVKLAHGRI